VDCLNPETKQNLHVVLVGIDPETLQSVDTESLKKQAAKAFGGNIGFEKPPTYYALETPIRAARITELLEQIKGAAKFKAERGGLDVVVFYYQGAEMLNQRDEIVLRTQDQVRDRPALTNQELKGLLSDMYGAHLLLLDVTQPAEITQDWDSGPFLGMLRNIHDQPMPGDAFPLISALEKALPKTRELNELPAELKQTFKKLDNRVPADLERVIIGWKR
jgi:hypothetical protein